MHGNGVSEDAGREHIKNLMREAWKKVNVHRAAASPVSQTVMRIILNLVRTAHCIYQHGVIIDLGVPKRAQRKSFKTLSGRRCTV
ncbi:hypothetical protein V6N11_032737 [Hibiscus sabdariffa]|uniref:Uncharacterized protein n=1 Tax=Hibiscus sabdariffa TaxID=183260 RepID=A0ABR2T278_9ROSI